MEHDVESNPGPKYCVYCGKGKAKDHVMAKHLLDRHYEDADDGKVQTYTTDCKVVEV